MDENQDLTIGADGLMNEGTDKTVEKSETDTGSSDVNKLMPPPEQSPITQKPESNEKPKTANVEVKVKTPPSDEDALDHEDTQSQVISEPPAPAESEQTDEKLSQEIVPQPQLEAPKESNISIEPGTEQSAQAKKTGENRNNKKLAAIVTIIVAIVLAAAAVYVYISAQNNTEEMNNDTAAGLEEDKSGTSPEIEQARQEVDDAVNNAEDEAGLEEGSLENQNPSAEAEI